MGDHVSDTKLRHDAEKSSDTEIQKVSEANVLNASGHVDVLKRQYGLLSICATALTVDNAWIALGGSITVAIANGGPPGVLYEFIVASVYYAFIAACVAELCSSIPSAGGVYHWAYSTAGKYGRIVGFFTGCLNFFGWIFDLASIAYIPANVLVQMYVVFHPDFEVEPWHQFLTYVLVNIICCAFVVFCNRLMPVLQTIGLVMVVAGGFVTIVVLAAMPKQHASASFVFRDWENTTGWPSGVAFLTGTLNGAFAIGTPASVTHFAEELPNPRRDLPKAVAVQMSLGAFSGFCFAIAMMFAISDLDGVVNSSGSFPLAEIYHQATGNKGGTFGLLFIVLISILICTIGTYITVGRLYWSLARDNVTPFSRLFSKASSKWSCPIPATVLCAVLAIGFGAIQLGSKTAFSDLVGSFIILTTTCYAIAVLSHLLSGRKNVPIGPFWMGQYGPYVNGITVVLIVFFNVMFCFPFAMPVDASTMNYNSVILVGLTLLTAVWWFIHGRTKYTGPRLPHLDEAGHEINDKI